MNKRRIFQLMVSAGFVALVVGLYFGSCTDVVSPPGDAGNINVPPSLQIIPPTPGADSLGYVMGWTPSRPGSRQAPIAQYNTELRDMPPDVTVYAGVVPADTTGATTIYSDTLWSAMPAFGDTSSVRGCVQAQDTFGLTSTFVCSPTFTFVLWPLPPNPPDTIIVDTIPPVPAASVVAVEVIPASVSLLVGETQQLCAMLTLSDGTTGLGEPVGGWTDTTGMLYCQGEYQAWLAGQLAPTKSATAPRSRQMWGGVPVEWLASN